MLTLHDHRATPPIHLKLLSLEAARIGDNALNR